MQVIKRDGRLEEFNEDKILESIKKAALAVEENDETIKKINEEIIEIRNQLIKLGYKSSEADNMAEEHVNEKYDGYLENGDYTEYDEDEALEVLGIITDILYELEEDGVEKIESEDIHAIVEKALMSQGHAKTVKEFILFRSKRNSVRDMHTSLMRTYEDITFGNSGDIELKRENANVDGDSAMGTMLRYGSEGAKQFNLMHLVSPDVSRAHKDGDIHIHDLDFLSLTQTCCQLDLNKLFNGGFNTGHGFLREPGEIRSYAALAAIAIQSNQNDMHGGQSIPAFDFYMAPGVSKTYVKKILEVVKIKYPKTDIDTLKKELKAYRESNKTVLDDKAKQEINEILNKHIVE